MIRRFTMRQQQQQLQQDDESSSAALGVGPTTTTNTSCGSSRNYSPRITAMRAGSRLLLLFVLCFCALNVLNMVVQNERDVMSYYTFDPLSTVSSTVTTPAVGRAQHHRSPSQSSDPICRALDDDSNTPFKFQLADPSYAQNMSEHRGGWKNVIQGLVDWDVLRMPTTNPSVNSNNNSSTMDPTILLVDIAEKWFVWDSKPMLQQPWLGLTHLVLHPPPPFQGMDLQDLLKNRNFQASLPYCLGLVVLNEDGVEPLQHELQSLQSKRIVVKKTKKKQRITTLDATLSQQVQPRQAQEERPSYSKLVCSMVHPIAVEPTATKYNPDIDVPQTVLKGAIVLLGQQYRRVATIHSFPTSTRKRLWLAGTQKPLVVNHVLKSVLQPSLKYEHVKLDSHVEMVYANSYQEYDDLLKHNLIVIDLVCATANNAVLEILALHVPAFVSRLPSTEQYLGTDYPLFFNDFDDLQALLDDEVNLPTLLREGHDYLKQLNKDRFSIQVLGESLRSCVTNNWMKRCGVEQDE